MAGKPEPGPDPLHVLIFPFPSAGHIIPLLQLTRRLLSAGRHATVLVTPPDLPLLQPLLCSRLQALVLSPPDPPPHSPDHRLPAKIRALQTLSGPVAAWFKAHPSPPTAIIADFFLGWTRRLARELDVRHLVFCPSGALGMAVFFSLWRDLPENPQPGNPDGLVEFDRIPGRPGFRWWQLSHIYTSGKEGDPDWEFFRESAVANLASWGMVMNSFSELESVYIDHLKKEVGHGRVWTVGPLLPPESGSNSDQGEVLTWLDRQPDSSVVYICFGSREVLSGDKTAALEAALGRCRVRFVWCPGKSGGGESLAGEERGLVVRGWAPQVAILRHRAVAAFVTHCGWNSALEAVAAGVGMVAWPLGADQFSDAKLVVEDLELAVRVPLGGSGPRNVPDPDELAGVLESAVGGVRPEPERVRRVQRAAAEAVEEGGSSCENLAELVRCLKQLGQCRVELGGPAQFSSPK